jgi:hypothetical protein
VFHRGEERGGIGSAALSLSDSDWLMTFDRAIAFDRRATGSVITHQLGTRCCSDEFAIELGKRLHGGCRDLVYTPDTTGSFTDTANYTELISECTNVSVGYMNEHSGHETLNVEHLARLRKAALVIDWESLPSLRDKMEIPPNRRYRSNKSFTRYVPPPVQPYSGGGVGYYHGGGGSHFGMWEGLTEFWEENEKETRFDRRGRPIGCICPTYGKRVSYCDAHREEDKAEAKGSTCDCPKGGASMLCPAHGREARTRSNQLIVEKARKKAAGECICPEDNSDGYRVFDLDCVVHRCQCRRDRAPYIGCPVHGCTCSAESTDARCRAHGRRSRCPSTSTTGVSRYCHVHQKVCVPNIPMADVLVREAHCTVAPGFWCATHETVCNECASPKGMYCYIHNRTCNPLGQLTLPAVVRPPPTLPAPSRCRHGKVGCLECSGECVCKSAGTALCKVHSSKVTCICYDMQKVNPYCMKHSLTMRDDQNSGYL